MRGQTYLCSSEPAVSTRGFAAHGAVVEVAGELDLRSAPLLRAAIASQIELGHRHLVIDLTDATFLDCASVGTLLDSIAPLRADPAAAVILAGASGGVERLLALLELEQLFEMLPDAEAATARAVDSSRKREGWRRLEIPPLLPDRQLPLIQQHGGDDELPT
jgi:anti-sigma B factor antagonist